MKAKRYNENPQYYPPEAGVIVFYCPGCKQNHYIHTLQPNSNGAMWTFNQDFIKPTFTPSIHIHWTDEGGVQHTTCHCFVTDGRIQMLGDSDNDLKGQTVDLPDIN